MFPKLRLRKSFDKYHVWTSVFPALKKSSTKKMLKLDHLSLPSLPASIEAATVETIVVETVVEAVVVAAVQRIANCPSKTDFQQRAARMNPKK